MFSLPSRLSDPTEAVGGALYQFARDMRCAIPGTIVSFDPNTQTCVVQPAIQEPIMLPAAVPATAPTQTTAPDPSTYVPKLVTIEPLQDVPIVFPRAGGYSITFPVQPGDEVLLVFADACIDGWFQSSGVQAPMEWRRHDLSDAFALFGPWSQPRRLANYSTSSMQIRSDDGNVVIDLASGAATITAPAITLSAADGRPLFLVTEAFLSYYSTTVLPFLESKGFTGGPAPMNAATTVLQGQ
jgi:hypothetical protein